MNLYRTVLFLLCSFFLPAVMFAQQGYSSGSLSMGKMRAASTSIPNPDEIVLEEYFNYHQHQIKVPTGEDRVALDLQWGHSDLTEKLDEVILQVGIATRKASSLQDLPPVNVTLVIDKSGSMRGDRIAKAREAAHAFVDRLRPGDILSIVAFDDGVDVVLPPLAMMGTAQAHRAIAMIREEGGTNLDLGMLTGYEQLAKHQKKGQTNRLIMLTDALTNTGITDPLEMVKHSQYYTADFEVDFTIVGVGTNFNQALSRKLTSSAHSSIFFLNDEEDLKKVFIDEVESLISPVGRNVNLEIPIPAGVEVMEVYGYEPTVQPKLLRIPLENMNGGLTMVVLLRLRIDSDHFHPKTQFEARLRYYDVRLQHGTTLASRERMGKIPQASASVKKNFSIAQMAQGLQQMATLYNKGQKKAAELRLNDALLRTALRFPDQTDPDIRRVFDILQKYQKDMQTLAQNNAE